MSKILKKDKTVFIKCMNTYLDKVCILKDRRVASDSIVPQRYIQTKYGVDYLVHEPDPCSSMYALFGRFEGSKEDYARLIADGIDCNPYTGKWNFLLSNCPADEAIAYIILQLKRIQKEAE